MFYETDTIAAVSTALGTGGIGIIRISGKNAGCIADGIFHAKISVAQMKSHTIQYGKIVDPATGEEVDEVMLTKMSAPATYTREDVIEINCHGNMISQRRILALLFHSGARPAEAGEFTKRAFLNGRIDLTQAEAVIDVINSRTSMSHDAAVAQLSGSVSGYLNSVIDRLLTVMARIEVTVDYPEHDDEMKEAVIARDELNDIKAELNRALQSYNTGRLIKSGINTVIIGKPNVGKSTLLNEMAGFQRAIVTDIPGTTRDIIEEEIDIDGILLNLTDTAGIRQTEDVVEQIGVNMAMGSLKNADLIIYVADLSDNQPVEEALIEEIRGRKAILVFNKEDLLGEEATVHRVSDIVAGCGLSPEDYRTVVTSLTDPGKRGASVVKEAVKELFVTGAVSKNEEIIITAERHVNLLEKSLNSLDSALCALQEDIPLDMISIDIRNAADFLGEITGTSIKEDLIDRIFSSFCLGK